MIKIPTKFLPPHLKQFTRKKTFFLWIGEERTIHPVSIWDGGSRDEWRAFSGKNPINIPVMTAPLMFGGEKTEFQIRDGQIALQFGTFMGKPATLKIHCANAADVLNPTLLNDPDFVEEFIDEPNLIAQLRAAKYDS